MDRDDRHEESPWPVPRCQPATGGISRKMPGNIMHVQLVDKEVHGVEGFEVTGSPEDMQPPDGRTCSHGRCQIASVYAVM